MEIQVTNPEAVAAVYIAVFGRAPDGKGLQFWLKNAITNHWSFPQLVDEMIQVAKQYPGFEHIDDPQVLVTNLYQNVLGKTYQDDPTGINWWVNVLKSGKYDPGYVVEQILETALKDYADDPATQTFLNRVEAAIETAERIYEPVDIDHDGQITKEDLKPFYDIISQVNNNPDSLNAVLNTLKAKPIVVDFSKLVEELEAQQSTSNIIDVDDLDAQDVFNLKDGTYYTFYSDDGDLYISPNPVNNAIGTATIQHTNSGVEVEIELNPQGKDGVYYSYEKLLIPNENTEYIEEWDGYGYDDNGNLIKVENVQGTYTENGNNFSLDLKGYVETPAYGEPLPLKVHVSGVCIPTSNDDCNSKFSQDSYAVVETPDGQIDVLSTLKHLADDDILIL